MTRDKLVVKPGDKVGMSWTSYTGKTNSLYEKIRDIYIVTRIRKDGVILVSDNRGIGTYQYDMYGNGKGRAKGNIRLLKEGEEEAYIESQKEEKIKKELERIEKDKQYYKELDICHKWVLNNAWQLNTIVCINCLMYIVSLPVPKAPATLTMTFEKRAYGDDYSVRLAILESRSDYLSNGSTVYTVERQDPMLAAAVWLQYHINSILLTEGISDV